MSLSASSIYNFICRFNEDIIVIYHFLIRELYAT